ncbi:MAG TPA: hypothetical protein VK907_02985 [Phnomibacter sp.]|nr:hypothetical protein [Phnomibacter sp.]
MLTHTIARPFNSNGVVPETAAMAYRFVIRPSDRLTEKVGHALIEAGLPSMQSLPAIELARFSSRQRMEDTLTRWTQRICHQTEGFSLSFNNFGGIPSHTIYLRIQDPSSIRGVVSELRKLDMYLTGNGNEALHTVSRFLLLIHTNIERELYVILM